MIRLRIKRDHVFRPSEITWQDRRIQPLCQLSKSTASSLRPNPDFR